MPTLNNSERTKHPATLRQMLIRLMTYYFSEVIFVNRSICLPSNTKQTLKVTEAFFPSIHSIPRLDIETE